MENFHMADYFISNINHRYYICNFHYISFIVFVDFSNINHYYYICDVKYILPCVISSSFSALEHFSLERRVKVCFIF